MSNRLIAIVVTALSLTAAPQAGAAVRYICSQSIAGPDGKIYGVVQAKFEQGPNTQNFDRLVTLTYQSHRTHKSTTLIEKMSYNDSDDDRFWNARGSATVRNDLGQWKLRLASHPLQKLVSLDFNLRDYAQAGKYRVRTSTHTVELIQFGCKKQ